MCVLFGWIIDPVPHMRSASASCLVHIGLFRVTAVFVLIFRVVRVRCSAVSFVLLKVKASSTPKRGADRQPQRKHAQRGQAQAIVGAVTTPSSASRSFSPSRLNQAVDVGESATGGHPHGGTCRRTGGSGSGGGGGDDVDDDEIGGESGDDSDELTAGEAESMISAAEQQLVGEMLEGRALSKSGITGDKNSGGGGGGEGGEGDRASPDGQATAGAVDVGVENSSDVARSGAGPCNPASLLSNHGCPGLSCHALLCRAMLRYSFGHYKAFGGKRKEYSEGRRRKHEAERVQQGRSCAECALVLGGVCLSRIVSFATYCFPAPLLDVRRSPPPSRVRNTHPCEFDVPLKRLARGSLEAGVHRGRREEVLPRLLLAESE